MLALVGTMYCIFISVLFIMNGLTQTGALLSSGFCLSGVWIDGKWDSPQCRVCLDEGHGSSVGRASDCHASDPGSIHVTADFYLPPLPPCPHSSKFGSWVYFRPGENEDGGESNGNLPHYDLCLVQSGLYS